MMLRVPGRLLLLCPHPPQHDRKQEICHEAYASHAAQRGSARKEKDKRNPFLIKSVALLTQQKQTNF